jgi:hypothetical protein
VLRGPGGSTVGLPAPSCVGGSDSGADDLDYGSGCGHGSRGHIVRAMRWGVGYRSGNWTCSVSGKASSLLSGLFRTLNLEVMGVAVHQGFNIARRCAAGRILIYLLPFRTQ